MDKLNLELAIKQHIVHGAKAEILNYQNDYVGIQYSNANGYYMLNGNIHMTYNGGSTGKSINEFRFCLHPLSVQFLTSIIPHAIYLEEVLEAIEEDNIEYIRHDLFTTIVENHGDVFGLIDRGLAVAIEREESNEK